MGSTTAVGVASLYLMPFLSLSFSYSHSLSLSLPARVPIPASCIPPPLPLTLLFLLSPFLYTRARCGRRRLRQVRLSLRFNIGENTVFYLIARYPAIRKEEVRECLRVYEENRGERGNLDMRTFGWDTHIGFRSSMIL